jgi:electron transfer flavoprotein alpha subunit
VASRRSNRRRELSTLSEDVEKQEIRRRTSEHAYRVKERDERAAEEDRSPVACATFLVGGGRGDHSYEPMHRY